MPLSRDSTGDNLSPITVEQVKAMIANRLIDAKAQESARECIYASSALEYLLKEIEEAECDGK